MRPEVPASIAQVKFGESAAIYAVLQVFLWKNNMIDAMVMLTIWAGPCLNRASVAGTSRW